MVVDLPCQDQFIRLICLNHLRQLPRDALGAAHGSHPQGLIDGMTHLHANFGINVRKGTITNILDENVVQPLLVSTSALSLATECVRMILKIDDICPVR